MREVHMVMKYVCEECGYTANMYVEKGLEEEVNQELKEKSGMDHKPVPFCIACPECGKGWMRHRSFWCFDKYLPVTKGMNLFINNPDEEMGVPTFKYSTQEDRIEDLGLLPITEEFARYMVDDLKLPLAYALEYSRLMTIDHEPNIVRILNERMVEFENERFENERFKKELEERENPLVRFSTSQLKEELRRRKGKQSWKRK